MQVGSDCTETTASTAASVILVQQLRISVVSCLHPGGPTRCQQLYFCEGEEGRKEGRLQRDYQDVVKVPVSN